MVLRNNPRSKANPELVEAAGLSNLMESPRSITDLPGVAEDVSSLCRAGVTVVLDEFQVCRRGTLSGFPSLLKARVDRLQDRRPVGGLILLGSVQTEMEASWGGSCAETTWPSCAPWRITALVRTRTCRSRGPECRWDRT